MGGGEVPDNIIDSASPANDKIFNALNSSFLSFVFGLLGEGDRNHAFGDTKHRTKAPLSPVTAKYDQE